MTRGVRFEVLDAGAVLAAHRATWESWAQTCSPFALPSFFEAWRTAFSDERTAFVIGGFRGAELELLIPMWHPVGDARAWSSLGAFRADYTDSIGRSDDPELVAALWRWLVLEAPCRSARIALVPEDSPIGRGIPHAGLAGRGRAFDAAMSLLRTRKVRYLDVHRYADHPYADRDQIRAMSTKLESKHNRKNVSMLRRSGEVVYDCLRGAEVAPALPTLFEMHIANFRGTGRASQFESPRERRFYELLSTTPGIASAMHVDRLSVGGRTIAIHLGFQHANRIYWYKPAFDLELHKLSPGRLLLAHVFERAEREQIERIDLLKGTEGYKTDWGNRVRVTHTVDVVERELADALTRSGRRARSYARSATAKLAEIARRFSGSERARE